MDINTVRGIATILAFGAFLAVCLWAYSARQKPRFEEAANLPFADDPEFQQGASKTLNSGEIKQ